MTIFENEVTQSFKKTELDVQGWSNEHSKLLELIFACGQK